MNSQVGRWRYQQTQQRASIASKVVPQRRDRAAGPQRLWSKGSSGWGAASTHRGGAGAGNYRVSILSPPSSFPDTLLPSSAQLPLRRRTNSQGTRTSEGFPVGKSRGTREEVWTRSGEEMGKKSGGERKSEKVGGEERKGGVTGDESARAQRREKETVKRRENAGSDHCLSSCAPGLSMLPSSVWRLFRKTQASTSKRRKWGSRSITAFPVSPSWHLTCHEDLESGALSLLFISSIPALSTRLDTS